MLSRNDQLVLKASRASSPTTGKGKGKGKRSKKNKKGKGTASAGSTVKAARTSKKRGILCKAKKTSKGKGNACGDDAEAGGGWNHTGYWGQDWGQDYAGYWGQDWEDWGPTKPSAADHKPGTGKRKQKQAAAEEKKQKVNKKPAVATADPEFFYPNSFARRTCPGNHEAGALWKAIVRTFHEEVLPQVQEKTRTKQEAGGSISGKMS